MRSLNVLLVEDDEPTKRAMSMLLRKMGHQFSAAGDIKSALGFAEQGRYDLVISDLGLPDGSGHELMREIKTKYGTSGIALSGFGMEEDIRKSHEAGFAEHLIKPITIEKLEAVIAKITG
jgi:CheY-like chemotaxis protein